ncbi:putative receptor-like protein kinase [Platanthera zijinensis]|uniref:non-specific serine/threonine protein kinase n=1 Tax=Platanthera zijinensis TaxID=2320716 RepID=A0AAP0BEW1_9ASPA
MSARSLPQPPVAAAGGSHGVRHLDSLLLTVVISFPLAILLLILLIFLYFRFSHRRSPTLPLDSIVPHCLRCFAFRDLRAATGNFDPSRSLGRGASAAVFRGILPDGKSVAVKRLESRISGSASFPDREFQNELQVLADLPHSPFVVSLLGYCLEGKRLPRGLLVYEYMSNGSLQEALFGSSRPILDWDRRFRIILDIARGLAFLHLDCDPPVIHGDIKPSNVLLGPDFQAKIADFGISRRKTDVAVLISGDMFSQELSPNPQIDIPLSSPPPNTCSSTHEKKLNPKISCDDDELESAVKCGESVDGSKRIRGKDWWWKQDAESGELSSKDYVREWIGSQICPSNNNPDWEDDRKSSPEFKQSNQTEKSEKCSLADSQNQDNVEDGCVKKDNKRMREWWKEEYFSEINNRGGKNCSRFSTAADSRIFMKGWKKRKGKSSLGSDICNSDLYSKELTCTTSTRGTVFYVAPETAGAGHPPEKADVYSFGVLILVIVAGRRPIHMQGSAMKFDRANLVSWCRKLAQAGDNILDIVDEKLGDSYDRDEANLCIKLALLCLQRTPELRPDSGDIVKMLKGEMVIPVPPLETSTSPAAKVLTRSTGRNRQEAE